GAERRRELLDALHEGFHPAAVRFRIEIRPLEPGRPARDHSTAGFRVTPVEHDARLPIDAASHELLLPAVPQRPNRRREIRWRLELLWRRSRRIIARRRRSKRFELGADGLARGDALGARHVVAVRVAGEELVAAGAESLPDRIRPALLHRSDGLPLGLQRANRRGCLIPVAGFGQRLAPHPERCLLREVLGPPRLPRAALLLAPRAPPLPRARRTA